ncbi:MAG: hypothetical protein R3C05_23200 [Pirellulaceae bacterium]
MPPSAGRNLFEQLLYACLLEDGTQDAADEGIARLEQDYFDWNEVRVTTVSELAESFPHLANPLEAASRLKKNLHALFETYYSFDIEEMKKQNLGKTVKDLSDFPAMTPFVLAYIVQQGLGGHAIPVNSAGLDIFYYCGIISDEERQTKKTPGIERAISKAKGPEFTSLLHQMSLEFAENPEDPELQKLICTVNPDAPELLPGEASEPSPKKSSKKAAQTSEDASDQEASPKEASKSSKKASKKSSAKKPSTKKSTTQPKKSKQSGTPKSAKKTNKKTSASRASTKKLAKKKPR